MLGDSITRGIDSAGLSNLLQAKGLGPVTIDGSTSRSITGGGIDGNKLSGMAAVDTDATAIKDAKMIIIGLGTNPGGSVSLGALASQIDQLISKVQALNSTAAIFWVNLVSTSSPQYPDRNNVLAQEAAKGYTVIDAKSANIPLSGDNIHPTAAGFAAMANLIAQVVTSGVSSNPSTSGASAGCNKGGCSTGSTILAGKDNAQKIFNFLVGQGFSPIQAESGFNPRRVQGTQTPSGDKDNITVDGTTGYGIVQWTSKGRQQALADLASKAGVISGDLSIQLQYVMVELKGNPVFGYKELLAATTIEEATNIVLVHYETPADIPGQRIVRTAFARDLLIQVGSGTGSSPTLMSSSTGSSGCASTGVGQYQNPFRSVPNIAQAGIDAGVDYSGDGPVYAIGNGVVTEANPHSGWVGGNVSSYKLSDGPAKDKVIFVAENCTNRNVKHSYLYHA